MSQTPARVGVIDLGSNSVLLLVAEHTPDGWQPLLDTTTITRLGEGFEPEKRLQPQAIERTLEAVESFLRTCQQMGVEQVHGVATAVVREAKNPEAILTPLRQRLEHYFPAGAFVRSSLQVLSEQREAELSFLSVAGDSQVSLEGSLAVIDIGGGSVEVGFGYQRLEESFSFPVGAGRVRALWMPSDPPTPDEILFACEKLDEVFTPLHVLPIPNLVVAIGGTGVNLAMLAQRLPMFDPRQVHLTELTSDQIGALFHFLAQMTDAERASLPSIEPERAPLLPAGTLILERALYALRQERVLISTYGVRYGVLWEYGRSGRNC